MRRIIVSGADLVEACCDGLWSVPRGDLSTIQLTEMMLFQERQDRGTPHAFQSTVVEHLLPHEVGRPDLEVRTRDLPVEFIQQIRGPLRTFLLPQPCAQDSVRRRL